MQYLVETGVEHRDLKASNCLVVLENAQYRVKLADFGLSKSKTLIMQTRGHKSNNSHCGTVTHMAPEVLSNSENIDFEKSDVYSFGIVMFELLSLAVPFEGLQPPQILAQVVSGIRPSPIPGDSPPELITLMQECWDAEPYERPDFESIVRELRFSPLGIEES